jgi:hypothetical protein
VITVRKLIWDTWNIQHIARHKITPDEVETVCHNQPIILRGQQKSRLVIIGSTDEALIITVILESNGKGKYYPITAYPASKQDITLYKRLKGGDFDNEK